MTLIRVHDGAPREGPETPDLDGARGVMAALVAGGLAWALLIGVAVTLWA